MDGKSGIHKATDTESMKFIWILIYLMLTCWSEDMRGYFEELLRRNEAKILQISRICFWNQSRGTERRDVA